MINGTFLPHWDNFTPLTSWSFASNFANLRRSHLHLLNDVELCSVTSTSSAPLEPDVWILPGLKLELRCRSDKPGREWGSARDKHD